MNILITAATENELLPAKQACANVPHQINCAVTGIGIAATAYHTTKQIQNGKYDLVINTGIAGSFSHRLAIGSVAVVDKEYFGDFGIQTPNGFDTLFDQQLLESHTFPFIDGALHCPPFTPEIAAALAGLPHATGITVNTASGQSAHIEALQTRFAPEVESMEGAAFFYVCLHEKIPFLELRAISNKVGPRDKSTWDIPLAFSNLRSVLKDFLQHL